MLNKMKRNKRGQLSEVMTWIIATIIILSILVIFIYASSALAKTTKILDVKTLEIDEEEIDLLAVKTSVAYAIASEGEKEIINNRRENNENE